MTDLDQRLSEELAALVSQYASLTEFRELQDKVSGIEGDITTINGQIETLQGDIEAVRGEIATAKSEVLAEVNRILADYATTASVDTKISTAKTELNNAISAQYTEKIKPLEDRVTTIENTIDDKIAAKVKELEGKVNGLLNTINLDLSRLVTGVIYQASNLNFVYDKMDHAANANLSNNNTTINFPYIGAVNVAQKANNKYNVEEADGNALFITINPTNVDFTDAFKASMALENSKGEASKIFKVGEVAATSDYLIKTRSAKNGFYAVTLKTSVNDVDYNPADVQKDHAFAVSVGNDVKKEVTKEDSETETRKVYSQYAIDLGLKKATPLAAADMKLVPSGVATEAGAYNILTDFEETGLKADLKVTARNAADDTKKAYKKYLEISSGTYSNGTAVTAADLAAINNSNAALQNPYDGHDFDGWVAEQKGDDSKADVKLMFDEKFNGCTFVIDYYVWNYDGSVLKKPYNITIAKKMFADTEASFVVTPTAATSQVADSKEDSENFANINWLKPGTNYNTWSANATKFDVKVVDENNVAVSTAAFTSLEFYNNDITPNYSHAYVLTNSAANGLALPAVADLAKFKNVKIGYDPSLLEVGKVYTMKLTFYNAQSNVVNEASFHVTMNRPNPTPAIWNGLLDYVKEANNEYVAWAKVSTTTNYAKNDILNNATNPLQNDGLGSKLIFKDVADYTIPANAPYKPVSTIIDASVTGEMLVPCNTIATTMSNAVGYDWNVETGKAANPRHVYTLKGGVQYYGLASLWNADATLYVTYKSPIQEADWVVPTYELTYPSSGTFNNHADVKDKSEGANKIKFFGATGVDPRIKDIKFVKTELYSTANYGLIEQYQVKHDAADEYQLYFKTRTTTTGAIPAETILPFYLKVTDVFNCEKVIVVNVKIVNPGA